jgi:hypothetical protein
MPKVVTGDVVTATEKAHQVIIAEGAPIITAPIITDSTNENTLEKTLSTLVTMLQHQSLPLQNQDSQHNIHQGSQRMPYESYKGKPYKSLYTDLPIYKLTLYMSE